MGHRGNERQDDPPVGKEFFHKYKGVRYTMTVVEINDGSIRFKVGDTVYSSPTAAAKGVVGANKFVNGRKFWHVD